MLPRVAAMLVLLHILGNGLIWRRRQRPVAVVSVCSGADSFRGLLDTPSYTCVNKWALSYGEWIVGTLGTCFSEDMVPFHPKNEIRVKMIKVFPNYLCPVARRLLISFSLPTACSMVVLFSCFYPFLFHKRDAEMLQFFVTTYGVTVRYCTNHACAIWIPQNSQVSEYEAKPYQSGSDVGVTRDKL